ncbi:MAG: hypothetical protein JXR90_00780, partial [Spirochaetes bacterium]|nr:hypothetical protein [Spirochaetota bacterium]
MKKKYILLPLVAALSFSAYSQQVIDIDFSKQDYVKDNVKISGPKDCISTAQGKIIYSSKNGDMKKHRWLNLKALAPLVKNFSAECSFGINYLHHWNGIKLVIKSESGGWSVEMQRRQQKKGQNELALITQIGGEKNITAVQETAKELSLKIVRKEDLLLFYRQLSNGNWEQIFEPVKVTTENAKATVNCWSPPHSSSQIIIRKFKL